MLTPARYSYLLMTSGMFFLMTSGMFLGCAKTASDVAISKPAATVPAFFTTDPHQSPYYGDSILYLQENASLSYQVKPVNSLGSGTYVGWPAGITVDPQSGAIDLLHSEPGARYNIGFVSSATHDTVYSQIILAGVSYPDGVYALDQGDSLLQPYYNAQLGVAVPSSESNLWNADGQPVNLSFTNGSINLRQSLQNGLFGSHPQNGDTKVITIYYRLNDESGNSLQSTSLVFRYYNTLQDVPASLLNTVRQAADSPIEPSTAGSGAKSGEGNIAPDGSTTPPPKIVVTGGPSKPAPTPARPPQVLIVNVGH